MLYPRVSPMLCRLEDVLPTRGDWLYEPKWDGFRGLLYKEGARATLLSRNGRDLGRYFPNIVAAASTMVDCVIDGEIVAVSDGKHDFERLQRALVGKPVTAAFVAFDLLAFEGSDLRGFPFSNRREVLEGIGFQDPFSVTPQTNDPVTAQAWIDTLAPLGFEGAVAKRASMPYRAGERAMVKVKHWETSDVVVGGYTGPPGRPRALLLGAFDSEGMLHHIGGTTLLRSDVADSLAVVLAPLEGHTSFTGIQPEMNRWQSNRTETWTPVAPRLVAEVSYNRIDSGRLRHAARLIRLRPDKDARACVVHELDRYVNMDPSI